MEARQPTSTELMHPGFLRLVLALVKHLIRLRLHLYRITAVSFFLCLVVVMGGAGFGACGIMGRLGELSRQA